MALFDAVIPEGRGCTAPASCPSGAAAARDAQVANAAARAHRGRQVAGAAVGLALLASLVLAAPLGRLRDPLVLVLVLPPLAAALDALGWSRMAATGLRKVRSPLARAMGAYAVWLATSALLTLDVAAVAAASVGLSVGGRRSAERDVQLGAAIVGANVGSLLFPFSNLTNLVLLVGAGISFRAYVETALWPQLATALGAGAVLLWRSRRRLAAEPATQPMADTPRRAAAGAPGETAIPGTALALAPDVEDASPSPSGRAAGLAGAIVLVGAALAVLAGFRGADIAAVFAVTAALVAALAVGDGQIGARALARSIPVAGVVVILGAALLGGPMAALAAHLPAPALATPTIPVLVAVALVGGGLAALANNLPAAAFGAVWLVGARPELVVAYLVGTNVLALLTPHGSLATLLSRAVAARGGHELPRGPYLRTAWRFALVGAAAALAALALLG